MKLRQLVLLSIAFASFSTQAAEEIDMQFSYAGNPGVDFSNSGTLVVSSFADDRSGGNPQLITDSDLGDYSADGGYQASSAVSALIQDALAQAFAKGNANLVETGAEMSVGGKLTAIDAQIVDREGVDHIQLTLRVSLQLQKGGRNIWQTNLFGRGRTPADEGMAVALDAALERLISELFSDDYFLQEVL